MLRLFLSTGPNPHPKWGRFTPKNRLNVDQVPLPFSCQPAETYEDKGTNRIWIKQNQAGLEKRFCTLQLAFRPGHNQPKPTCIFRGLGKRIGELEKASWDSRVHVMFQKKTWADRAFSNEWLDQVLLPDIQKNTAPGEESILFCDNLDAQIQPEFKERLRSVGCFRYLLPLQCTDYVQPVDAGLGRQVKSEIGKAFEEWLEGADNLTL